MERRKNALDNKYVKELEELFSKKLNFLNEKDKLLLKFNCSQCNKEITVNGATSHSKLCGERVYEDKKNFIVKKYSFPTICLICGEEIVHKHSLDNGYKTFCSSKCQLEALNIVRLNKRLETKVCLECKQEFRQVKQGSNYCSKECSTKGLSKGVKNHWDRTRGSEDYKQRCEKISKNSNFRGSHIPWNKELTGKEYLKHFEKNGINTLYRGLEKNNGYFRKTLPEKLFEVFLKELNLRYQYSFFCCHRQFDFLVSLEEYVLIIEVDGDYYHKSKRICLDENERKITRLEDKLKEKVIDKIKNTDKKWKVLRFWEIDIYNEPLKVKDFLIKVVNNEHTDKINNIFSKIEEYYLEKS